MKKPTFEDLLYELEHNFLPVILFSDKKNQLVNPFYIGNEFKRVCNLFLSQRIKKERLKNIRIPINSFTAGSITVKSEDRTLFYILCLMFPFFAMEEYNALCVKSYIIHGIYGENPQYFTLEYDNDTKPNGSYWLCRWIRDEESDKPVHINYGPRDITDLESLENEELVNFGVEIFGNGKIGEAEYVES